MRILHSVFLVAIISLVHVSKTVFSYESDAAIHKYAFHYQKMIEDFNVTYSLHHGISLGAKAACYDYVGCFYPNGSLSYLGIWSVPASPDDINTSFFLYTKQNPRKPVKLDYRDIRTLANSTLQMKKPVKVICHGFGGSSNLTWVQDMKNAFLEKEDIHVIVVDWSKGAAAPNYLAAVPNSELVGRQIAVLLYQIRINFAVNWDQMHIIGFSMGAQVAGFVGKSTQQMYNGKVARISALDAAGPLYEGYGPDVHVDSSDAKFVDSIHTNANDRISGGVGMRDPIGHVDFYPNGGKTQPGCNYNNIVGFLKDIFTGEKEKECHHVRAVYIYIESIRKTSCSFIAYQCASFDQFEDNKCFLCNNGKCGRMGYHVEGLGTYYTITNSYQPFCALPLLLAAESSKIQNSTFGQLKIRLYAKSGEKHTVELSDKRTKLQPGQIFAKLIPASPRLNALSKVQITFSSFKGYFRTGYQHWTVNNTLIMTPSGTLFSACHLNLQLEDSEFVTIAPSKC